MLENKLATKFCTLASGTQVTPWTGSPNVLDMAWSIGRLCRWGGSAESWYSLMQHTFVVCDLVPGHVKIFALLHDAAPECVGNDVPKPIKNPTTSLMEDGIFTRTCERYRLTLPSVAEWDLIHEADAKAAIAEAWVIGNAGHRASYPERCPDAELLTRKYIEMYSISELISRQGQPAHEFVERFLDYYRLRFYYLAALRRHDLKP